MNVKALPPASSQQAEPTHFFGDTDDPRITTPEEKVVSLESQVRRLKLEADEAKRVLAPIRKQLEPLYNALRILFGQLDAAGIDTATSTAASTGSSPKNSVWDSWKSRLGGKCPEIIDLLLIHGDMTHAQLMAAMKCHYNTVKNNISTMNKAGILMKNGGRFSLRQ